MDNTREKLWRALPFVMAILLTTLIPLQGAQALFGKEQRGDAAPGAPIAQTQELKTYCGVAYTGTLSAVDNEGESVTFALVEAPKKGVLELSEDGVFVYTPNRNKAGADSFTFTATDASGNTSSPAAVKIRIAKPSSGVSYADTDTCASATAAMELAERGVFVGAKVGDRYFFEPERTVTRGEFVAMCLKAANLHESDVTVTGFCDDESIPTWAKSVAASALRSGMVRGVTTAEGVAFRAENAVTLGEAATVLNRLLEVTDVDVGELYGEAAGAWSAQAVANLESVSLLPSGSFGSPALAQTLTRAEAAELLSAAMTLIDRHAEPAGFFGRLFD